MRLYLDTNIFLDATLPNRTDQQDARRLFNLIASGAAVAYTASFSIATITYFLQKVFKEDTASIVEEILMYIDVVDLQKDDFIVGHTLGFDDLEDAYQYMAAQKAGRIDYIVTQNVKDFKQSAIDIIKPAALLKLL